MIIVRYIYYLVSITIMNLWDGMGLLLFNILHNNQLKELGDTSNNAMVTLPVHVFLG